MARSVLLAAVLAVGASAEGAAAGEDAERTGPFGPAFGDNAYRSEVRDEGAPDADDFVGPLAAGETLSVSIRAARGSALRPGLALFDPAGAERTPMLRESADGSGVSFRRFQADRTGRWLVRILGRDETEGAYEVRFRVSPPRGRRTVRVRVGGGAPLVAVVPFEAVRGSALSLSLRTPPSPLPPYLEVIDPAGRPIPEAAGLLERERGMLAFRGLLLDGPDGTWRIVVGVDPDARPAGLAFRVEPPQRPRRTVDLDPAEPLLAPRGEPAAAVAGGMVRLAGRGFSEAPPPAVLVGGRTVEVLRVAEGGRCLDLRLPPSVPAGLFDAVVVNPDGQACSEPFAVRVLPPGPSAVRGLAPQPVRVVAKRTATVSVLLSGHAPPEGAEVALAAEGGLVAVPASIRTAPFALEALFDLVAGKTPGRGVLAASFGGRTATVPVEVLAPPPQEEIDLSGWRLVQTDSPRSFTVPPATRLRRGAALVVARKASRAAFEAFWGAALGPDAVYVDSGDAFPSLNGDETLALVDADGVAVDGPTARFTAGRIEQRKPGAPAGDPASWISLLAVPGDATPGRGEGDAGAGVVVSEIADPAGTGQFVYEFVEIRWDAP